MSKRLLQYAKGQQIRPNRPPQYFFRYINTDKSGNLVEPPPISKEYVEGYDSILVIENHSRHFDMLQDGTMVPKQGKNQSNF